MVRPVRCGVDTRLADRRAPTTRRDSSTGVASGTSDSIVACPADVAGRVVVVRGDLVRLIAESALIASVAVKAVCLVRPRSYG